MFATQRLHVQCPSVGRPCVGRRRGSSRCSAQCRATGPMRSPSGIKQEAPFQARLSHKSPGAKVRRQLSRSKDFWEGSETNQSPGNGSVWAAADICDSLTRFRHSEPCAPARASSVPAECRFAPRASASLGLTRTLGARPLRERARGVDTEAPSAGAARLDIGNN